LPANTKIMIDRLTSSFSAVSLKNFAFFTRFGGQSLMALICMIVIAFVDGNTIADVYSSSMIMKMKANNTGITDLEAQMMAHRYVENVSIVIMFVIAYASFSFRITPPVDGSKTLKNRSHWLTAGLVFIGTFGKMYAMMMANGGLSLLEMFSIGVNVTTFIGAAAAAAMPAMIIEGIAIQIEKKYAPAIIEINDVSDGKLIAKIKDDLTTDPKVRKRTSFLSITPTAKTGTNS